MSSLNEILIASAGLLSTFVFHSRTPPHPPPPAMETKAAVNSVVDTLASGSTFKHAKNMVSADNGITAAALESAYHRSRRGTLRAHGTSLLDRHQQHVLMGIAQAFSLNNDPHTSSQIRGLIKRRWDVDVSPPWITRSVKRNRQHLSLRSCKDLADKRAG